MRRQQIIAENNQYKRIIAPRNWKPSDESVDIIQVFNSHRDVNKRFILLISDDITTYTLLSSFYHTISERVGGVDMVVNLPTGNSSFTFTTGSTHRWIIVSRVGVNSYSQGYIGAIWVHNCRQLAVGLSASNQYARIITCQDLSDITLLLSNQENSNLDGELTIPRNAALSMIGDRIFRNTKLRGKLVIPENITRLGNTDNIGQTFQSCLFDGELYLHDKLTYITINTFQNCNGITKIVWQAPLQESTVTFARLGTMTGVTEVQLLPDKRGVAWSWSINIDKLSSLNAAAIVNIFNALLDLNTIGLPVRTITIGATNLNKLSQTEKDIALNKGYTLA